MTIGIGLGLATYTFSTAEGYWRWVKRCDRAGVDSLWQTDRLISKEPFLECMTTMAAVASATKRLKFGMNVASAGIRDPLLLAHAQLTRAVIVFVAQSQAVEKFLGPRTVRARTKEHPQQNVLQGGIALQ